MIQHIRENLAAWQIIRAKAAARGGNMHAISPIRYIQFANAAALDGKICVCGAILHIQLVNAAVLQRNDSAAGHLQIADITALQRKAPALTPIKEDILNLTALSAVGNRQMHIVSGLEECAVTFNRHHMSVQIDRMRSAANAPCTIRSGIIAIQLQCAAVFQPCIEGFGEILIIGDRAVLRHAGSKLCSTLTLSVHNVVGVRLDDTFLGVEKTGSNIFNMPILLTGKVDIFTVLVKQHTASGKDCLQPGSIHPLDAHHPIKDPIVQRCICDA